MIVATIIRLPILSQNICQCHVESVVHLPVRFLLSLPSGCQCGLQGRARQHLHRVDLGIDIQRQNEVVSRGRRFDPRDWVCHTALHDSLRRDAQSFLVQHIFGTLSLRETPPRSFPRVTRHYPPETVGCQCRRAVWVLAMGCPGEAQVGFLRAMSPYVGP